MSFDEAEPIKIARECVALVKMRNLIELIKKA
jgi:hypothetical protein